MVTEEAREGEISENSAFDKIVDVVGVNIIPKNSGLAKK